MVNVTAVLLAAGQGTRMHSDLPKVLHPLLGRPMIQYAIEAATQATGRKPVVVIGHKAESIRPVVGETGDLVLQEPQLGTGHAVQQVEAMLKGQAEFILVAPVDLPLLSAETLEMLAREQARQVGPITMLTRVTQESRGFGRVVRSPSGMVCEIVEEALATPEQLAIQEVNVGVYCFTAFWLWRALLEIPLSPKGEYFLTDLIKMAADEGQSIQAIPLADPDEAIGINNRLHLAEAETALRRKVNQRLMLAGVTLIDPSVTYIEPSVTIGRDTVVWPNTYLQGESVIGEGCQLGPNTLIQDSRVGNHCKVFASVLENAVMEDHVDIGPYGHLRKGAHLAEGVHMGNFGEVKNSYLAPGVKMGHFSYIGDANVGEDVNIGAGTITCNFGFDGKKNKTEIGAGAFIGSDTLLVAPVRVGEGAATGSGAVVTRDVPPGMLAVGVPARAIKKLNKPKVQENPG